MGEKYLIQGGNKVRMSQIPMGKYTIEGESSGITSDQVEQIGDALGVNWNDIDLNQLYQGTLVEASEHSDIVGSNTEKAVRIALAHVREIPDYYDRLKAMEGDEEVSIPKTQSDVNQMRFEADEDVSKSEQVQSASLSELLPCPYNREIDKNKIENIKQAIKETGEIKPFVVTEVNTDNGKQLMITDGHHRYLALKEMGKDDIEVPVVMADEEGINSAKDEELVSLGKGGPGSGRRPSGQGGIATTKHPMDLQPNEYVSMSPDDRHYQDGLGMKGKAGYSVYTVPHPSGVNSLIVHRLNKGGPGSGRFSDDVSGVKLQVARHLRRQGVITRKKK